MLSRGLGLKDKSWQNVNFFLGYTKLKRTLNHMIHDSKYKFDLIMIESTPEELKSERAVGDAGPVGQPWITS